MAEYETICIPDLREFPHLGEIHGVPIVELSMLSHVHGEHLLDWQAVLGGPKGGKDSRLFLDVPTLRRLLDMAEASLSKRVQLDLCGVRIKQWVAPGGHRYQTWTIVSIPPKSEETMMDGVLGR